MTACTMRLPFDLRTCGAPGVVRWRHLVACEACAPCLGHLPDVEPVRRRSEPAPPMPDDVGPVVAGD